MSKFNDVVARMIALRDKRAFAVREAFGIGADPELVFAITPVKMVSEEIVQAVAYGCPDEPPTVLARWNPLSRESGDLEPFARALGNYLERAAGANALPRIWVPHESALEVIALLGRRYKSNQKASDPLRLMGAQCCALVEEADYVGQQVVAVASKLLRTHFVTGQTPVKDAHLGAIMAWIDPPHGVDPATEADRRALVPASGVLRREDDDEVERLRKVAKKRRGPEAARARSRIEALLKRGALDEWNLLMQARRAFWGQGLIRAPATTLLVEASRERILDALKWLPNPPTKPDGLARELEAREDAVGLLEAADVRGDARMRERARAKGRVIRAEVLSIAQPRKSQKPCEITLRSDQQVLRVRVGTLLEKVTGEAQGRVVDITEAPDGRRLIRLDLTKGVQKSRLPALGSTDDWTDIIAEDLSFLRAKVYQRMTEAAAPLVYGNDVTPTMPANQFPVDLLAIAKGLKAS